MSFPTSILEFQDRFSTEEACWRYLAEIRWPNGFHCPYDGSKEETFISTRRLWRCAEGHDISVTTGTVMQGTHLPLRKWFWVAYLVVTNKTGLSGTSVCRQFGGRYESSYMMLQKLRAAMVCAQSEKMGGVVEIDETYVSAGRMRPTRRGRGSSKPVVIAAVQDKDSYAGQLRIRRISSVASESIAKFVTHYITRGSTIITDGLGSYAQLSSLGYRHIVRRGASSTEVAKQLPHVHRVFSNLKAWLNGTHHGVSGKHLQAYLNEYAFRFNHRHDLHAAFHRVLGLGSEQYAPRYRQLYGAGEANGWDHPTERQCQ